MAVKTKAQILSEISTLLADNTSGDISANDVRTVVNDITDSYENLITAGTTSQYWRGDKTFQTLPLLEVSGTLSAAQINNSEDTPIALLPVAGTNKYYIINNSTFHFKSGGTGYDGSFTALKLGYEGSFITNAITSEFMTTTNTIYNSYPTEYDYTASNVLNKALWVFADESIFGGNGTINYSISYRIVTTS